MRPDLNIIPFVRRTVHDPVEGKDIVLSNEDLEMLRQMQKHGFPEGYDPYQVFRIFQDVALYPV